MIVFGDTSGFVALLARDDYMHVRAKLNFAHFGAHDFRILATSYALLETTALLLRRIGLEAVSDFHAKIVPLLEIVWVDAEWHTRALRRLFSDGRKDVSLVDCMSFEVMKARNLQTAFAFDKHFEETGFTLASFHDLDAFRSARPAGVKKPRFVRRLPNKSTQTTSPGSAEGLPSSTRKLLTSASVADRPEHRRVTA